MILCECGKTIPLTEVLVGIVVPIVAAWSSFFLADRALRKKENNKLYIQIELIRRELKNNDEQLSSFIDSFMRKKDLDKALEFPLMFMKSFLIDMLDELQVIKESYMHSGTYLFERPIKLLLLGEEKELVIFEIDSDIVKESHFDQEEFDLFYKAFENPDGMEQKLYNLCELYYKRKALKNFLLNHDFEFQNNRWNENSADFVIINDRNLYISLVELYEKLTCSDEIADGGDYEEKYQYSIECHKEITKILNVLEQYEVEVKKKCK